LLEEFLSHLQVYIFPLEEISYSKDHAYKMADLALTLQRNFAVYQKKCGQPHIKLRIGLNIGPVVAGIIGTHTIHYDVWSDAVNTASRMESNAQDGAIQV
jgi:adenylate cyclase